MHDNRITKMIDIPMSTAVHVRRRLQTLEKVHLNKKRKAQRQARKKSRT